MVVVVAVGGSGHVRGKKKLWRQKKFFSFLKCKYVLLFFPRGYGTVLRVVAVGAVVVI